MVKVVVIRVDDKDWEKINRVKKRHSDTWRDVLFKYAKMYS